MGLGWVAKGEQVWQALGGDARQVWWLVMLWVG